MKIANKNVVQQIDISQLIKELDENVKLIINKKRNFKNIEYDDYSSYMDDFLASKLSPYILFDYIKKINNITDENKQIDVSKVWVTDNLQNIFIDYDTKLLRIIQGHSKISARKSVSWLILGIYPATLIKNEKYNFKDNVAYVVEDWLINKPG
jgi:hypothetical protein